jgi:dihydroorotase
MRTDKITIPRWFDRHLHLREEEMLETVLPYTLRSQAAGAIVMGNLRHPHETSTIFNAETYRARIMRLIPTGVDFTPLMTCYLTDEITPDEVVEGYERGIWRAVKLYLSGAAGTTNAGHGVKDFHGRYPVFAAMEKHGIPLLGHFESPDEGVDEFDREYVGLCRYLDPLMVSFPGLKIVFEHITDGRSAEYVDENGPNLYATVTAHHLLCDRNAIFAGGMNPLHWCKPVLKRREHQLAVRKFVTSGHPRFGAGTDSAPHDRRNKSRCVGCAAGIFTAPAAPALYATVFDEDNALEYFEAFMSKNFLDIYGTKPSTTTMTLCRETFFIPEAVGTSDAGVVEVFKGGTPLNWKLAD